jgi:hypothetical protein
MGEIIEQYGKIIIAIIAILALIVVITLLVRGKSGNGESIVTNLFRSLLQSFAAKSGLDGINTNGSYTGTNGGTWTGGTQAGSGAIGNQ